MVIRVVDAIIFFVAGGINPGTRSLPTKQFRFGDCASRGKNTRDIIVWQHSMEEGIAVHFLLEFGRPLRVEKFVTTMDVSMSFTMSYSRIKHLVKSFLFPNATTSNFRRTILCGERIGFILHQQEMRRYIVTQQTSECNPENQENSFENDGSMSFPVRRPFTDIFKGDFLGALADTVRGRGGLFFLGELVEVCVQVGFLGHGIGNVVWDWVRIEVVVAHGNEGVELYGEEMVMN
jgi:hypothetical protein